MFQLPDTEMMEKFSKKLQIVQEKFLAARFVRWYHYNITICAANPGQYLADRTFLADAVGESAERMKTGRKNFSFS